MTPEIAARLESRGILPAAEAQGYCMFVRANCIALVHTADGIFKSIGSSGMMTENGLAYLVWHDGKAMLSSHGCQVDAADEDVQAIQAFSDDLKKAIWPHTD